MMPRFDWGALLTETLIVGCGCPALGWLIALAGQILVGEIAERLLWAPAWLAPVLLAIGWALLRAGRYRRERRWVWVVPALLWLGLLVIPPLLLLAYNATHGAAAIPTAPDAFSPAMWGYACKQRALSLQLTFAAPLLCAMTTAIVALLPIRGAGPGATPRRFAPEERA